MLYIQAAASITGSIITPILINLPFSCSCGSRNTWWNFVSTFAILLGHTIFDFGILFLVSGSSCLFGNPKPCIQKQSNFANNFPEWREKISKNVIIHILLRQIRKNPRIYLYFCFKFVRSNWIPILIAYKKILISRIKLKNFVIELLKSWITVFCLLVKYVIMCVNEFLKYFKSFSAICIEKLYLYLSTSDTAGFNKSGFA